MKHGYDTQFGASQTLAKTLLLSGSLALLAACSGSEEAGPTPISIVGSSTVFPFAQQVGEDFVAANEGAVAPVIQSTGTSEGLAALCAGATPEAPSPDIANASRRITLDELNACTANGVTELVEIKVGRDGIAFASAVDEGIDLALTSAAVYRALAAKPFGEEQTSENWSDVSGSLPNEPIIVYGPPSTSGTRDALVKLVMAPACKSDGAMAALEGEDAGAFAINCLSLREDAAYIDQGEQDDLIVRKVANNPRAVGIFGYSYLEENAETIKALSLGGVLPTAETIADGSYPASRPLYLYVNKAKVASTPGIEAYLAQWAKSWSADGPLAAIGLVPATEEAQAASASSVANLTVLTSDALTAE